MPAVSPRLYACGAIPLSLCLLRVPSGESHVSFCLFLQFSLSVPSLFVALYLLGIASPLPLAMALFAVCYRSVPFTVSLSLSTSHPLPLSCCLLVSPSAVPPRASVYLCTAFTSRSLLLFLCVSLAIWVLRERELEVKEEQDAKSKKKRKHNQTNRRPKPESCLCQPRHISALVAALLIRFSLSFLPCLFMQLLFLSCPRLPLPLRRRQRI